MKAEIVTASILAFLSNKKSILNPSWGRTLKMLSWKKALEASLHSPLLGGLGGMHPALIRAPKTKQSHSWSLAFQNERSQEMTFCTIKAPGGL